MHLQTTTENMILTLKFIFGKVKQIVVKRRHNLVAEFSALSRIFTKTFCLVLFNYNNVKKKTKKKIRNKKKKKKKSSSDLYQILEVFNKCCLTRND